MAKSTLVPDTEYMLVQIEEVDVPNRIAHVRDKTGILIQVGFNYQYGGLTFIPAMGEVWRACRYGFKWYLEDRVDSEEDFNQASTMQPGDARISANGLGIRATNTYLNFRPLGATVVDVFHLAPPTGHLAVTLTHSAVSSEVVHPTLNGLIVPPAVWNYNSENRTVSFLHEMGYGYLQVTYETWMNYSDDAAVISSKGYVTADEEFDPA